LQSNPPGATITARRPSAGGFDELEKMKANQTSLNRIHLLLAIQSITVVLVSINRLGSFTLGYVAPNQFLRWVDFNNMLPLALISAVGFYLLMQHMQSGSQSRTASGLAVVFVAGVYVLGASYGDHEVTNYLHTRFCAVDTTSDLCRIVIFNDDEFSHWLFFTGFTVVNAVLLFWQVAFPYAGRLSRRDALFLGLNALFIGAGIFANLAFEQIGLDLVVVALLAALSLGLLWRKGAQPLFVYYSLAYVLGLVATGLVKMG
jgi:hypothetical protein